MRRSEFERLLYGGVLMLLIGHPHDGVAVAQARTGSRFTMRPDLPGLPVVGSADGRADKPANP
jgi:hypothetical protein